MLSKLDNICWYFCSYSNSILIDCESVDLCVYAIGQNSWHAYRILFLKLISMKLNQIFKLQCLISFKFVLQKTATNL